MPGRPPPEKRLFRLLHKDNISVDDQRIPVSIPKLRLRGLANTGRAKKHQTMAAKINQRAVELDDAALDSVGVEDLLNHQGHTRCGFHI